MQDAFDSLHVLGNARLGLGFSLHGLGASCQRDWKESGRRGLYQPRLMEGLFHDALKSLSADVALALESASNS